MIATMIHETLRDLELVILTASGPFSFGSTGAKGVVIKQTCCRWSDPFRFNNLADYYRVTFQEDMDIKAAIAAGASAPRGSANPYDQREGDTWHIDRQDELWAAWRDGYRSQL